MKTPLTYGSLFLMSLAGVLCESAASTTDPAAPAPKAHLALPNLSIDRTPVNETAKESTVSYADVIEPVQKAVVSVYSTKFVHGRMAPRPSTQQPDRDKEQGLGSGVIVSANGFILTNHHVVEGADELSISLPDGREFKAVLVGTDPKTDIAVLKIDAAPLPFVTLADSDKLRVGDVVFAVGNPLGIGQTVTMGIVSAKGRNSLGLIEGGYENFIQTDAAINLGNSGGALVDAKGRLVGINSAIVSTTRGNIGIGLAIPVNFAATIMNSLIDTGTVARGYLGISVDAVTPDATGAAGVLHEAKGVVVTQVNPAGPAAAAGIARSDIILSIDGKAVNSVQDLRLQVAQAAPESEVSIHMIRDGAEKTVRAKLGRLAETNLGNELLSGVEVARLNDDLRRQLNVAPQVEGLLVVKTDPRSPYSEKLLPGMIILEINRKPVTDIDSARTSIATGRNLLFVYYKSTLRYLVIARDSR